MMSAYVKRFSLGRGTTSIGKRIFSDIIRRKSNISNTWCSACVPDRPAADEVSEEGGIDTVINEDRSRQNKLADRNNTRKL